MTLDKLPVGKQATIISVGGEGALRCRLLDMGLIPKTKVTIRKVAPMGDPIEIHIRGYELSIRIADARQIEIEESGEE
ncbi:MAG: ferrous iron transport protein A [Ruminococcus sp.]|nr:ferrous iron transport protein A [Ruminococcus sp.]